MMNKDQELFELCKEVYKRTGWLGIHNTAEAFKVTTPIGSESAPLYTSDYLLEKLPPYVRRKNRSMEHWIKFAFKLRMSTKNSGNWRAGYYNSPSKQHLRELNIETNADTPLKALLKLIIALDDAGVKL